MFAHFFATPSSVYRWGELSPEQLGCRTLLELCLALPHICYVHDVPAENQVLEKEHWICATPYHCLRSNYRCTAESLRLGNLYVAPNVEEDSSENNITKEGENCSRLRSAPDFCELKSNVAKVLKNSPEGILKSAFVSRYEEVIGQKLEARTFGFFNTSALLRSLQGNVVDIKVQSGGKEVKVFSYTE